MQLRTLITKYSKVVGFSWAGWLFDFYNLILYSFLLLYIPSDLNLTDGQLSLIYSFSLSITALGGIVLGYLSDVFGRRTIIITSVSIFAVGALLSAFSQGFYTLLIFQLITGFGIGGEWGVGHTLVNETLPKQYRGRASALIQTGAPLGAALASAIGSFITPIIGWRWTFLGSGAVSAILAFLMIFLLPESPKFLIFKAESLDEHRLLTNCKEPLIIDSDNIEGCGEEKMAPRGAGYIRMTLNYQLKDLAAVKKTILLGTILSLFALMSYWLIFSWAPKYLKTILGDAKWVGQITLLAQLGAFIGYVSFGYIADLTKRPKLTFLGFTIILGIGAIIFAFANENRTMLVAAFMTIGLGTGIFSGFGPLFAKIFPQKVRATGTSACFNIGRLGTFFAPVIVNILMGTSFGFSGAIILGAILAIMAGLWIFLIPSIDTLE